MAKYVRQSKEEIRRRRIRKALILALSAALLITGGVLFFRKRVQQQFAAGNAEEVESAEVTVGSIKTTISGSGNLASEGVIDVEIPVKIMVEDTLVQAGDSVEEGQLLATVNVSSALSALKELQEELESLDSDIQSAGDDTASAYITAGVAGRVKAILVRMTMCPQPWPSTARSFCSRLTGTWRRISLPEVLTQGMRSKSPTPPDWSTRAQSHRWRTALPPC